MSNSNFRNAVKAGDKFTVRNILSEKGSLAVDVDETGQAPLHDAVEALIDNIVDDTDGLVGVVQALLNCKADANAKSPVVQATALQAVLQSRNTSTATEIACLLLKARADPNSQDSLGEGPLSEAVLACNYEACQLLLRYGASPNMLNDSGQSALDLAVEMECKHIKGKKIKTIIEAASGEELGPAAKKTLEAVSTVLARGTEKPKARRERWRHRAKLETEIQLNEDLESASNDGQSNGTHGTLHRNEAAVSSTSPPTKSVESNYVIAESARDFRVTLPLDAFFVLKQTENSWQDQVDVQLKPSSKYLEVRVSGPSLEDGVTRVCWVLSTPLGKEVRPECIESEINVGRLTVVLPKASIDTASCKPARELPHWCRRDKDRRPSTSDFECNSSLAASLRRPSDTSSSHRLHAMGDQRQTRGSFSEEPDRDDQVDSYAQRRPSDTSSSHRLHPMDDQRQTCGSLSEEHHRDDNQADSYVEAQYETGIANLSEREKNKENENRAFNREAYVPCLASHSDPSLSDDGRRLFVGNVMPPAPPPPLTNAIRGSRGKMRCKCRDHGDQRGGDASNHSRKEESDEIALLRSEGNEFYKACGYEQAREKYTAALTLHPDHAGILTNRAAASMMLGDWLSAYHDALGAAQLECNNGRAHERCARCLLMLNRIKEGMEFCHENLKDLASEERQNHEWRSFAITAQRICKYETVLREVDTLLASSSDEAAACTVLRHLNELQNGLSELEMKSTFGLHVRLSKVRAWLLQSPSESGQRAHARQSWTGDALKEIQKMCIEFPNDADSYYWQAICFLRNGERSKARESLKETMRLANGDHESAEEALDCLRVSEAQKELGNQAFKADRFEEALQHYNVAVQADHHRHDASFSASLFCNRAAAFHKQLSLQPALEDIDKAITLLPKYAKALFRRGLLRMDLEDYLEAATDFDSVAEIEPSFTGLLDHRRRARCWAQRPPVRNYYALLNVPFTVGEIELKRAYKVAALRWHPDKHPSENRALAETRFKEVKEGFEILSHADRRCEYDGLDHFKDCCRGNPQRRSRR